MNDLENLMYEVFANEVRSWPRDLAGDIYALSFYYDSEGGEYDEFRIVLGYNTLSWLKKQIPHASDEAEAKWNFAFWSQECKAEVGIGVANDSLSEQVKNALRMENLYLSADEIDDMLKTDLDRYEQFAYAQSEYIWSACINLAQRLHQSGVIETVLGRAIPVIIHELEYYDEIATRTKKGNPPGLTREFEDWIQSM